MRNKFKPTSPKVEFVWGAKDDNPFVIFQKIIKDSKSETDAANFNKYVNKKIDLETCFERFKTYHHTKIKEVGNIDIEMFKRWIETLGYRA